MFLRNCPRSEYLQPTEEEVRYCIQHGMEKENWSKAHGLQDKHGCNFTPAQSCFITCMSEICEGVASLSMGWPIALTCGTFHVPDLPGSIEVKFIKYDRYGLTVRDNEPDDSRVMGVVYDISGRTVDPDFLKTPFRLPGWITAGEARHLMKTKYNEWYTDFDNGREYVTSVPQYKLHPMSELRAILVNEGLSTNTDRLIHPFS